MPVIVECVPNISEGRRPEVVDRCAAAIGAAASLLDVTSDRVHHRSVLTFAGEPAAVRTAALALFDVALATIDLRRHQGEHPRVGAVDVVPFVPLGDTTIDACVELAHSLGETVADRFGLPVYLYERASRPGAYRRLEEIRRGGLPGLTARMPRIAKRRYTVSRIRSRAPVVAADAPAGLPMEDHCSGVCGGRQNREFVLSQLRS